MFLALSQALAVLPFEGDADMRVWLERLLAGGAPVAEDEAKRAAKRVAPRGLATRGATLFELLPKLVRRAGVHYSFDWVQWRYEVCARSCSPGLGEIVAAIELDRPTSSGALGHARCYVQRAGRWWCCDDEIVTEVTSPVVDFAQFDVVFRRRA